MSLCPLFTRRESIHSYARHCFGWQHHTGECIALNIWSQLEYVCACSYVYLVAVQLSVGEYEIDDISKCVYSISCRKRGAEYSNVSVDFEPVRLLWLSMGGCVWGLANFPPAASGCTVWADHVLALYLPLPGASCASLWHGRSSNVCHVVGAESNVMYILRKRI